MYMYLFNLRDSTRDTTRIYANIEVCRGAPTWKAIFINFP